MLMATLKPLVIFIFHNAMLGAKEIKVIMKKNIIYKVVCLIGFLRALPSYSSWDNTGKITFLEVSQEIRVKLETMSVNPGSCNSPVEYALETSHINYSEIYSLLLSAHAQDKLVSVDLNGCSTSGLNSVFGVRFAQ